MPPRGRGRSGSRAGGGRSGSGPSDSKPAALRRIMQGISGSKSKASEGASQSVPGAVSSSSSQPTEVGSDSDSSDDSCIDNFRIDSSADSEDSDDSDSDGEIGGFEPIERGQLSECQSGGYDPYERAKLISSLAKNLPCHGIMLLLFETPTGFALCTFPGAYCYLPDSEDNIWAEFGDTLRATMIIYPKGILSLEDKSSAITDAGVDKQLVDMINKWHHPGMKLCVGKPEYKRIIESVLKIPCMCSQTVMEIMWGLQQQLHALMPKEKPKLTKEDRLPMSQGLMKFLRNCGFDIKPEMVNEKIFLTACALFHCDVDDKKNSRLLLDARLSIRRISGIACEDWDILKLALAVKVIRCPDEELTDFHEVLAEDVVSKLKGDAHKYKVNPFKINWFRASDTVVSSHHLRIAKRKLLGSLVKKAKKAYEAEQEKLEKAKLDREYPTNLVGEVLRRIPRLNPIIGRYHARPDGTPDKRPKHSCTSGSPMVMVG